MTLGIIISILGIVAIVVIALVRGGSDGPDPYDGEGW